MGVERALWGTIRYGENFMVMEMQKYAIGAREVDEFCRAKELRYDQYSSILF